MNVTYSPEYTKGEVQIAVNASIVEPDSRASGQHIVPRNAQVSSGNTSEMRDLASIDEQNAINNLMMYDDDELDIDRYTRQLEKQREKTFSGPFWNKNI